MGRVLHGDGLQKNCSCLNLSLLYKSFIVSPIGNKSRTHLEATDSNSSMEIKKCLHMRSVEK